MFTRLIFLEYYFIVPVKFSFFSYIFFYIFLYIYVYINIYCQPYEIKIFIQLLKVFQNLAQSYCPCFELLLKSFYFAQTDLFIALPNLFAQKVLLDFCFVLSYILNIHPYFS